MIGGQTAKIIDWKKLVDAINKQECILVLGPNICTLEQDGKIISLNQLLAEHLAQKLLVINPDLVLLNTSNLAYVAQQLEEALLTTKECNHLIGKARSELRKIVQAFYQDYNYSQFPVYKELAKLPFSFVVNTCPDHFLERAYKANRKMDARTEFYHYGDPSLNNKIDDDSFSKPDEDAPLVFNLFGSVKRKESLVITETNQLLFLDKILQEEGKASIPNNIAMEFKSSQKEGFEKTYIFLGFDFNQWHLRLIVYLINRYQRQKEAYALQNPRSLSDLTTYFYDKNYQVEFVDSQPEVFVNELLEKIQTFQVPVQTNEQEPPKLNAFLMYDHHDQDAKDIFDRHLTVLKRSRFIQTWDEGKIKAGSERDKVIEENINQADIILLLVSSHFMASDNIYEVQLQKALERHNNNETTIIPILMKSCDWENSGLQGLSSTKLPRRNEKPLMEQENQEAAFAEALRKLKAWCEDIYQMKMEQII